MNPVLAVLAVTAIPGAWLAFLTHAPNRLLAGAPVTLGLPLALTPAIALAACAVLPRRRWAPLVTGIVSLALVAGLLWLAGARAAALAAASPPAARTSVGAGAWLLLLAAALAYADAVRGRPLLGFALLLPVAALLWSGRLNELSLLREYDVRKAAFAADFTRHVVLVLGTLAPTLAIGVPLGFLAQRRPRLRTAIFGTLNIVQTIPSIALFGLLMAPLAATGAGGTGILPALIALTLYCLLPIARNTAAGLLGVPADVKDAARGMGMTPAQILWRVEAPLALPTLLAGLRITTVQAIGLAVIAALIGAGGLGAIMFEGLFSNALDLVLLGVIPTVLLALLADAALGWLERAA